MLIEPKEFIKRTLKLNADPSVLYTMVNELLSETIIDKDSSNDIIEYPEVNSPLKDAVFYVLCSPINSSYRLIALKENDLTHLNNSLEKDEFYSPLFQVIKEISN